MPESLKPAKEVASFSANPRRDALAQQCGEIAAKLLDSPATGFNHQQPEPGMNAEHRDMATFPGDLSSWIDETQLLQLLSPFMKEGLRRWLKPWQLFSEPGSPAG